MPTTFADELAALLAAAGVEAPPLRAGARLCVTAGNLEIAVAITRNEIVVELAGWRQTFATGEDEDGVDAEALALDLIGAALFGAARVVVDLYDGRPRRFTLQTRRAADWQTASVQGSRPWNPLARRTGEVRACEAERPPRYRPSAALPLPWAPWAGLAGFFGAAAGDAPAELPVDGVLDLHNFSPREVKPLVLAYLDACLARGITEVRIIHGKGIGNLRRTVHALLERHPRVRGFRLGGHGGGGWGATIVDLSPEPGSPPPGA